MHGVGLHCVGRHGGFTGRCTGRPFGLRPLRCIVGLRRRGRHLDLGRARWADGLKSEDSDEQDHHARGGGQGRGPAPDAARRSGTRLNRIQRRAYLAQQV
jgi:hypothetical protein